MRGLLRRPLCSYEATSGLAEEIGAGETDYQRFDRRVADAACAWLAEPKRAEGPWCAFVSILSPHYPLIAPPGMLDLYEPADFESERGAGARAPRAAGNRRLLRP